MLTALAACSDDSAQPTSSGVSEPTVTITPAVTPSGGNEDTTDAIQPASFAGRVTRELSFEPVEPSFYTEDPSIVMIEINQSLSYGFDTDRPPVDVTVRFPENAARIVMIRGETEIYSTQVSANAPQVAFTGLTDYEQFLMVYLGVMDAPGGRFEPSRPLTQAEAALILYSVIGIADPDIVDHDIDLADIVEIFVDNDIIDASGPNTYSESQNLTNRLALVRLSRLYNVLFE